MTERLPLPAPLEADSSLRALGNLASRLDTLPLERLMVYLIDIVDPSALSWLAAQFSLVGDGWELAESDEVRRTLIKSAIELHRYKGTPWSIREIIRRMGFGDIELYEGENQLAPEIADKYPKETRWALYQVTLLESAITNDQAVLLRKTLAAFAPARCHLAVLDYTAVPIRYNNKAHYNGQYNHGSS